MSVRVAGAVLLCAFFFTGFVLETEALCCKGAGGKSCDNKFCGDCTRRIQYGTIQWPSYSCCSHGTCNAFCCNCNDKCRKPPAGKTHQCTSGWLKRDCNLVDDKQKRSLFQEDDTYFTVEKFNRIDRDDDLKISHDEMKAHFGNEMHDDHVANEFNKIDQDQSGFIEAQEFDNDLTEEMLKY